MDNSSVIFISGAIIAGTLVILLGGFSDSISRKLGYATADPNKGKKSNYYKTKGAEYDLADDVSL